MNRQIATATILLCAGTLINGAHANECFAAAGEVGADAQVIRLKAEVMGWQVGKAASLSAATVVKGKVALYPKALVETCLRSDPELGLAIRAQASSSDAGTAEWRKLPAKRLGK